MTGAKKGKSRTKASAALVIFALIAAAGGDEAVTINGRRAEGELSGAGANVEFVGGGASIPLRDLSRVRLREGTGAVALVAGVVTDDGSTMRGAVSTGSDGAVTIASARLGRLTLALEKIAEVYFESRRTLPEGPPAGALFRNGDFLPADSMTILASSVRIKSQIGDVEVPLERVAALRLKDTKRPQGRDYASVILDNGDVINGTLISAGDLVKITTSAGDVEVSRSFICDVHFPSRMASVDELPLETTRRGFAPEGVVYCQAVRGGGAEPNSRTRFYGRGLLTRAGAVVTVKLPAGARALCFVPEISKDSNPSAGRFAVEVDGKEIWAAKLNASEAPEPVTVVLPNARAVTLSYQSEPAGLIGSLGVWGDAFVTIAAAAKE